MLQHMPISSQKFGDVSRQTMRVVEIIAAWVVNTFYNYLHQEAVALHTKGRVGSITDGYRFIVKQYLDSFNSADGYKRLVITLHKYYVDNSHCAAIAFDEWTREILEQFVPLDYKAIMSNEQQDILLRNILIGAIEQFSSDVVCTKLLDLLISNHDEPSIVPQMKATMKAVLLAERQKIFNGIHRASTGSESAPQLSLKREICSLVEENVVLKSKNTKLIASVKKSLEGMKLRDKAITALKTQVGDLQRQLQTHPAQSQLIVQQRSPAEEFKSALANIDPRPAHTDSYDVRGGSHSGSHSVHDQRDMRGDQHEMSMIDSARMSTMGETRASLPEFMLKASNVANGGRNNMNNGHEFTQDRYANRSNPTPHQSEAMAIQEGRSRWSSIRAPGGDAESITTGAVPLSNIEKMPEPFEQADPAPEDDAESVDVDVKPTGNDTIHLDMDEFLNG